MDNRENDSFDVIIEKNKKYLNMFEKFLAKRNYREKTIEKHLSRVDYYINDYLMWGIPKHMEKGCSTEIVGFIEYKVNEKVIPASVHNIDFFLSSISLFYECMCEHRIIKRDQFEEFKRDIRELKDEMVEDYYDKNPKKIEMFDVVDAIETGHDVGEAYMNNKTGEVEYIEQEYFFREEYDEKYEKLEGLNWVKLPEFRDYDIMKGFALQLSDNNKSEKLLNILHNKKAYRNFKNEIYEMDVENDYYDFYQLYIEQLARQWLEENTDESDEDMFD